MALSGKSALAIAEYYESHFEWTYFGDGSGKRVVCVDELRDFFIECNYPDHVVDWARKIPRQPGQIKEHILATRKQTAWMLRFARDILNRAFPRGRFDDLRRRARLLETLAADGYTFENAVLVGSPETLERDQADAPPVTTAPAVSKPASVATTTTTETVTDRECMLKTACAGPS